MTVTTSCGPLKLTMTQLSRYGTLRVKLHIRQRVIMQVASAQLFISVSSPSSSIKAGCFDTRHRRSYREERNK